MTASVEDLTEAMKDVVDPELGINVVDLGLLQHYLDTPISSHCGQFCPVLGNLDGLNLYLVMPSN